MSLVGCAEESVDASGDGFPEGKEAGREGRRVDGEDLARRGGRRTALVCTLENFKTSGFVPG